MVVEISSANLKLFKSSPSMFIPFSSQSILRNMLSRCAVNSLGDIVSPCQTPFTILISLMSLCSLMIESSADLRLVKFLCMRVWVCAEEKTWVQAPLWDSLNSCQNISTCIIKKLFHSLTPLWLHWRYCTDMNIMNSNPVTLRLLQIQLYLFTQAFGSDQDDKCRAEQSRQHLNCKNACQWNT